MNRQKKLLLVILGLVLLAFALSYAVTGSFFGFREAPPEFEILVETPAMNAVAFINGRRIKLGQKSDDRWSGSLNGIGSVDSIHRMVEIRGVSNTAYRIEIRHHGKVVDEETGMTDKTTFRSPESGAKLVVLR